MGSVCALDAVGPSMSAAALRDHAQAMLDDLGA
jgi:hypothetical protein